MMHTSEVIRNPTANSLQVGLFEIQLISNSPSVNLHRCRVRNSTAVRASFSLTPLAMALAAQRARQPQSPSAPRP
jgi:hypothetical protein